MEYRTALVTGASSGIGHELALRLARLGVEVALAARREDRLQALREQIEREGGRARVVRLDVSDPGATVETIRRLDEDMRGLDLVVANAGVGRSARDGSLAWADCAPIVRVNVEGALATLTAVLDRMVERRSGHLVGISSLAGYRALPHNVVYSASKAFLSAVLEGLRIELKSAGVLVTDVQPGFVETPMTSEGKHRKPFMMSVSAAVDEIVRGLEKERSVIAFPWPLVAIARVAKSLPAPMYDVVAARAVAPRSRD